MQGLKTGGRLPGTPNKATTEIRQLLEENFPNYHPVLSLVAIANDLDNDVSIRLQANKEVAKYICPQLKSIEVKEQDSETKIIVVRYQDEKTKDLIEQL